MVTKLHTSKVFFCFFLNIRVCVWGRQSGRGSGGLACCCIRVAAGHDAVGPLLLLLPLTNGPCNFLATISSHISALVNLFWRWVMKYASLALRLLFHVTFHRPPALVSHSHLWWVCGQQERGGGSVFSAQINLANMRP